MYSRLPSFVLGFHGCDESVALDAVSGRQPLIASNNKYDWLGSGIYFWENSPQRALEYATQRMKHPLPGKAPAITKPSVVGAIIDLGRCLNLLDYEYLNIVHESYLSLVEALTEAGEPLPKNHRPKNSNEVLLRDLDCAVINFLHIERQTRKMSSFDSVRAAFIEGAPLYDNSGFSERNHIQLCIRNHDCIKGYFLPVKSSLTTSADS